MSTNDQTSEYTRAYAELERIAARLKSGPVALDELDALLKRADELAVIINERVAATRQLVRRPSSARPSPNT